MRKQIRASLPGHCAPAAGCGTARSAFRHTTDTHGNRGTHAALARTPQGNVAIHTVSLHSARCRVRCSGGVACSIPRLHSRMARSGARADTAPPATRTAHSPAAGQTPATGDAAPHTVRPMRRAPRPTIRVQFPTRSPLPPHTHHLADVRGCPATAPLRAGCEIGKFPRATQCGKHERFQRRARRHRNQAGIRLPRAIRGQHAKPLRCAHACDARSIFG